MEHEIEAASPAPESEAAAPYFTVLLPTFNRERELPRCIASVRSQTFGDWELLIVDDGSTDGSRALIEAIEDDRIRYVYKENAGVAVARNFGIEHAAGRYICFIDSDDEFLPRHLEVLHEFIEESHEKVAMFHTLAYESDGETRELVDEYPRTAACQVLPGHNPKTTAICIHADILKKHRFNESLTRHSDAELWNRIDYHYPIIKIDEPTAVRHLDIGERMSRTSMNTLLGWEKTYLLMLRDRKDRAPVPRALLRKIIHDLNLKMAAETCVAGDTLGTWHRLARVAWYGPRSLLTRRFYSLALRGLLGAKDTAPPPA